MPMAAVSQESHMARYLDTLPMVAVAIQVVSSRMARYLDNRMLVVVKVKERNVFCAAAEVALALQVVAPLDQHSPGDLLACGLSYDMRI